MGDQSRCSETQGTDSFTNDTHEFGRHVLRLSDEDQRALSKLQNRLHAQQQSPTDSAGLDSETSVRADHQHVLEGQAESSFSENGAFAQHDIGSTAEVFFMGTPERGTRRSLVDSSSDVQESFTQHVLQLSPVNPSIDASAMSSKTQACHRNNISCCSDAAPISVPAFHTAAPASADISVPVPWEQAQVPQSPAEDLLEECSFLSPGLPASDVGRNITSPSQGEMNSATGCRHVSSPLGDLTTDSGTAGTSPPNSDLSSGSPSSPKKLADICFEQQTVSLQGFEKLNSLLLRNGFREVPHRLECCEQATDSPPRLPKLAIESSGLWELCAEILRGFEDRGKRLQDSVHRTLSEERQQRDARIQGLLRQNSRLTEEVQSLQEEIGRRNADGSKYSGTPSRTKEIEKEFHEASLRVRAAEAAARCRDRELDRLKGKLEQLLDADQRRQASAREAVSKWTRDRRTAVSNNKDGTLLEMVRAFQSQIESLTAEGKLLSKQVHTLTFELEAAESRGRKLEAAQQLQPPNLSESCDASSAVTCSQSSLLASQQKMEDMVVQERALRTELQEQLLKQQVSHETDSARLSATLHHARSELQEAICERQEAERAPTPGERKWKREALRARDELAEVRRLWRVTDSREGMRRDKDLKALGLDSHGLQERVHKGDLVRLLLDICQVLRVGDLVQILPRLRNLDSAISALSGVESFADSVLSLLSKVSGSNTTPSPTEALQILQHLCDEVNDLHTRKPPVQEPSPTEEQHGNVMGQKENQHCPTMIEHWVDHAQEGAPSASELQWRREALRARNELADARRNWRASDSRELMKRDKELKNLGLDADRLAESVSKQDLVTYIVDVCRVLHVGDMAEVLTKLRGLEDKITKLPEMEAFSQESCALVKELVGAEGDLGPAEGLEHLRQLRLEVLDLRSRAEVARTSSEVLAGSVPASRHKSQPFGMTEGQSLSAANEVSELRVSDAVLRGLVAQLHASSIHDVPQRVSALLRLCDERMAAERIVEALQRLLHVSNVAEILPALKESLDVNSLMKRRHAPHKGNAPE
eukprot:gnl/MRDRNA2_/MRDRNA2_101199_c0_seq1.p1 gnl/MRDRNA2_/MRDRNA2_101199_c0~~gnl/MRDRNA2_/MRDRNA2_101199_c0_seq1.p1  ORF type:complete len:1060 (-),score=211.34 gnl/MRDRNA2_/MRDRNA2_101199_c0_seq1:45-3197(-)